MQKTVEMHGMRKNESADQLRDRASHFRWAAGSAKSLLGPQDLLGMAISLEAEANALDAASISFEQPDLANEMTAPVGDAREATPLRS